MAYAGKDAHVVLPLSPGDEIVIDASRASLQAGATNPEGVAGWLGQGATVYSIEGLHAKVLRFALADSEVTVVGSGNASANSRDQLIEASILTHDKDTAAGVDEFIDKLIAEVGVPLDDAWLGAARKIHRAPRLNGPKRRRRAIFPFEDRQLWVSSWIDNPQPVSKQTAAALQAAELDFDSNVSVWAWGLHKGDEKQVKPGDGLVLVTIPDSGAAKERWDGRWSTSIGRVVRVLAPKGSSPDAIVAFDGDLPNKRVGQISALYEAHDGDREFETPVPAGSVLHAAILALWASKPAETPKEDQ